MIASEEKRKRLLGIVTRWAKHTKADQMLRDGDITGLVGQILDEFYHIHLCCGHMVDSFDEEVPLLIKDIDPETGNPAILSGVYCKDCAEWFKKEGAVLNNIKEERAYLARGEKMVERYLKNNGLDTLQRGLSDAAQGRVSKVDPNTL